MKIQRFENTLFNMLSLQQDIVNGLYYLPKDGAEHTGESKGRYVFDVFYNTKLLQKSGMRKNVVIDLIYRGFI